jgi:cytoplasmic tRNA 2-thiolation protein 2
LLAISFGYCSLSLLAILDGHLKRQKEQTGRVGYQLFVLHVLGADAHESPYSAPSKLEKLQKRFPNHKFSSIALEDAVSGHTSKDSDPDHLPITAQVLQNLSASSHEDMMLIARNRLIMQQARMLGCTHVLYGDSTSKLSERILAETAKGRGYALPQIIGDATPPGEVANLYPLRDIFRTEMEEYAKAIVPELWALVAESERISQSEGRTVSARNMTIDKLMAHYVTEMEGNTPSIVASVLRTSAKLTQPSRSSLCPACGLAMDEGASGLRGWGGDQAIDLDGAGQSQGHEHHDVELCYGCSRSLRGG